MDIDAPEGGEAVIDAPEGGEAVIEEFTLPEDFAEQVRSWDIPVEDIAQAVALHKSVQTEEGVIDGFIRFGQSLGFGIKELERLFQEDTPAPAPAAVPAAPAEPEDPDRLMTAAEVSELLERERQERLQFEQQRLAQEQDARRNAISGAMQQFFEAKGVPDVETQQFIAGFGNKYLTAAQAANLDPATAVATLEKAYADYEAYLDKQAAAYLAKKGQTLTALPTAIGGGQTSGGESDEEAPDYGALGSKALETAKDRVRRRLRAEGAQL